MTIRDLKPKEIWQQFDEICKIPRPSKKEEKMVKYLVDFAKKHKLEYQVDETGNVIIRKDAVKGYENKPSVALQSHIDMVCEKNSDKVHDFEKDPIIPIVDGDWVRADGTTLGADDGIGVAAQLAILASDNIEHGPIECIFTVDEETGLTGAFGLQPGVIKSDILINLDSEDDGEIFIGCAGGIDTVGTLAYTTVNSPKDYKGFKVSITGLKGGHSGDDIDKGRGNSNKLLNRFITDYSDKNKIGLYDFDGGNLRNAIPREATAIILIPEKDINKLEKEVIKFEKVIKEELSITDPNVKISLENVVKPRIMMSDADFVKFTKLIYTIHSGVLSMSYKLKGIVETSSNLASIKFNNKKAIITTSQRSDSESQKMYMANIIKHSFLAAGAKVKQGDGYPGWSPNPDSKILKIALQVYKDLFNEEAIFRSIHAGLECGLFSTKYPNLDMISYGPTLRGVHSPDEKIEIKTVEKFWDMTLEILKRV
ncbi:MAG: aminoacyl-histidine dipeptidase [Bacteroidales bacterium]|jgi:dipeptidase D